MTIPLLNGIYTDLSPGTQAFFRMAAGVLLLGILSRALRHGRRFFLSERWGGYGQSSPEVNVLQNPIVYPYLMVCWFFCAIAILLGIWSVWAALINLLLCHYYFVRMRWKGVLRGMGALGFMTHWLSAAVFLLESTFHYAPGLRSLALLVLQADFAFIMFSAGIYKLTAGYASNHGMELGMANPEWGRWWRFWSRLPPGHWLFHTFNHFAWSTEIVAAALMLLPPTRFLGGVLIIVSFIFITTQIRLTLICEVVMLCGVLFFRPGSLGDQLLSSLVPSSFYSSGAEINIATTVNLFLAIGLLAYIVLLPLAHAGLFYNFYRRKSLSRVFQRILEAYTNFFGIIIWRVFSVDVVNFFILIYRQPRSGGQRVLISDYGRWGGRFSHVAESITLTSVFTTLKYYPSNSKIFTERLLRYARTLQCPSNALLIFEYRSIQKTETHFAYVPVAEFVVDPQASTVTERVLSEIVSIRAAHRISPVHEGSRPGSYVPLGA